MGVQNSVTLVVDTECKILRRGRAGCQFTKLGDGGGEHGKNLTRLHFTTRSAMHDEYGIGLDNPAILEISAPKIMLGPEHTMADGSANDPKKGGYGYSAVWVQYVLIDANQVEKLDRKVCTGPYLDAPDTPGDWGHYKVGGEELRCRERERERINGDFGVAFCWEPLGEVQQRTRGHGQYTYSEWRPIDYQTLDRHLLTLQM